MKSKHYARIPEGGFELLTTDGETTMSCDYPRASAFYTTNSAQLLSKTFSYADLPSFTNDPIPEEEQISVTVNNGADLVLDTDYTVNTTADTITLIGDAATALALGDFVRIRLDIDKCTRYVQWTNNSIQTATNHNTADEQLQFIGLEALDYAESALRRNLTSPNFDALALQIKNGLAGTDANDFVTLQQATEISNGSTSATIGYSRVFTFVGDGVTTDFDMELESPFDTYASSMFLVSVDGRKAGSIPVGSGDQYQQTDDIGGGLGWNGSTIGSGDTDTDTTPQAFNDFATVAKGATLAAIDVLANDNARGTNTLTNTIQIDTTTVTADHGTPSDNGDGTIEYVHDNSDHMPPTDQFRYRVQDDAGQWSNWATVFIEVTGISESDCCFEPRFYQEDGTIKFTKAPASGESITVTLLEGTIRTTFGASVVETASIADDAVTLDKMGFDTGDAKRFIVINASGDPTARTIFAGDISDFNTGVQLNKLNEMATPDGAVDMGVFKITSLASGTNSADAVNKAQLDAAQSSATSDATSAATAAAKPDTSQATLNGSGIAVFTLSSSFTPSMIQIDSVITGGTDDSFGPATLFNPSSGDNTLWIKRHRYSDDEDSANASWTVNLSGSTVTVTTGDAGLSGIALNMIAFK